MNQSEYQRYYKAQLESALQFQDFVVECCFHILRMPISLYGSKLYQQQVGESLTGVEIKYDKNYCNTGNLYIETAEKALPRDGDFAPSGIYRSDNSWLYIIGDYDTLFVFSKKILIALHRSNKYKQVEIKIKTSQGMLLPELDAKKYSSVIMKPNAKSKIEKSIVAIDDLACSMFASMLTKHSTQLMLDFGDFDVQVKGAH